MNISIPYLDSLSCFFLGNLSNLEISSIAGDSVEITVTARYGDDSYTMKESYIPCDGKVKLYDIRDIIEPLFPDLIENEYTSFGIRELPKVSLYVKAVDSSGTHEYRYYCVYSKGKIDSSPADFTKFYTQSRDRSCRWDEMQVISFPAGLLCEIGLAYYSVTGVPSWKKMRTATGTIGVNILNISAAHLVDMMELQGVDPRDCMYLEATLYNSEKTEKLDKMKVVFTNDIAGDGFVTFLFTNFFGMKETMTFKGAPSETIVMESSLGYFGDRLAKYDNDIYIRSKANSGHLDKEHYAQLQDLLHSSTLYVVEPMKSASLLPEAKLIVIEEIDVTRQTASAKIQNASITYLYTEKWERSLYLANTVNNRIFDISFDDSFN